MELRLSFILLQENPIEWASGAMTLKLLPALAFIPREDLNEAFKVQISFGKG